MELITRHISSTDWITSIFITCLILLVVLRLVNSVKFFDFLTLFTDNKYLSTQQKQHKGSNLFNTILVSIQILTVALFIYITYQTFDWKTDTKGFFLYTQITIAYMLFVLCKLLIEKIIAVIFSIESLIEEYTFAKLSYRNYLGILLLPIVLFLAYTITPTQILLQIICVIFALLNVTSLILFYKKQENIIYSNLFYFILYLCTLEIAPYFVVYKLFIL